jgi:hypothetical protein
MAFLLSWAGGMTGVWLAFPATEFNVSILALSLYLARKKNISATIKNK